MPFSLQSLVSITAEESSHVHAAGRWLLHIIGTANEDTALYVINWVLGSKFTKALSLHLPCANSTEELLLPHLMPQLKSQLIELFCRAKEANLADILALTSLMKLSLDKVQVGEGAPLAAWQLPVLRSLRLAGCKGLLAALIQAGSLPKLEKFRAVGCKFGIGSGGSFDFLLRFASLQSLQLRDCDLHQLPSLAALTRLKTLEVTGSDRVQDLRPVLSGLQSLTALNTIGIWPTDQFVAALLSVPSVVCLAVDFPDAGMYEAYHLSSLSAVMSDRKRAMHIREIE